MRLWSLYPKYLDAKGLVAVWREGLLAKKVLQGKTKGYINHPQLIRFKSHPSLNKAINYYLFHIFKESCQRGFCFNKSKINQPSDLIKKIKVHSGQIDYEFDHLKKKLKVRNPKSFKKMIKTKNIEVHPLFVVVKGKVESWERKKVF